jgi:hypothetical protein
MTTQHEKAEHRRNYTLRAPKTLAAIIDAAAQEEQRPAGNLLLRIVTTWAQSRTSGGQAAQA